MVHLFMPITSCFQGNTTPLKNSEGVKGTAAGTNPYGSVGAAGTTSTGEFAANRTQVLDATNKDTLKDEKQKSASSEKHNISYKTHESIVRMPGCVVCQIAPIYHSCSQVSGCLVSATTADKIEQGTESKSQHVPHSSCMQISCRRRTVIE